MQRFSNRRLALAGVRPVPWAMLQAITQRPQPEHLPGTGTSTLTMVISALPIAGTG
jgi:hypothetical protein